MKLHLRKGTPTEIACILDKLWDYLDRVETLLNDYSDLSPWGPPPDTGPPVWAEVIAVEPLILCLSRGEIE